jgi:hypothetical protein
MPLRKNPDPHDFWTRKCVVCGEPASPVYLRSPEDKPHGWHCRTHWRLRADTQTHFADFMVRLFVTSELAWVPGRMHEDD